MAFVSRIAPPACRPSSPRAVRPPGPCTQAASPPPASRDAATQTEHVDAHSHMIGPGYSPPQVFDFSERLDQGILAQLPLLTEAGVREVLCMPIPTNIEAGPLGCHGGLHSLGRTYYLPDRYRDHPESLDLPAFDRCAQVGQYYNSSVDWQMALAWSRLPPAVQARLHLSVTGVNLADPHGVHATMRLKLEHPGIFFWMGETTRRKEVVDQQNRNYRPGDHAAAEHRYLEFLERAGMGLTLHHDISDARECLRTGGAGQLEYLDELRSLLRAHPGNVVVLAHLGGLGRFSPPSRHHHALLRSLLSEFPRLHIDMSWDAVARWYSPNPAPAPNLHADQRAAFDPLQDAQQRQRRIRRLAGVIEQFKTRFLMGSDTLVSRSADSISGTYGVYANQGQGPGTGLRRGLFDYLSHDTLDRVLQGNFRRLHAQAREAGSRYEAEGLGQDMAAIQQQALAHGRTPNHWPD